MTDHDIRGLTPGVSTIEPADSGTVPHVNAAGGRPPMPVPRDPQAPEEAGPSPRLELADGAAAHDDK
ncbi:hypothetical protein IGS68_24725 [Skermanella sp. TT6]|uniref:Uncharacterized protein n=1 Tax=Skermanella cutis TaxID=2775420 RepID=A0ABX7B473_9PROT|nr:hypothetical protein [Skermanella sp. TT6]QQP89159.1 hypothetical protein IGS68_24725 [Skermanella sp. TT6]